MKRKHVRNALCKLLVAAMSVGMLSGGRAVAYAEEMVVPTQSERNDQEDSKAALEKISTLHNPISDVTNESVDYSYVYFGSYPQSEVTGEALTDAIIHAEYVSGDAVVNGEMYYRMEADVEEVRYFKYEPIRWRVIQLHGNEALLRSDMVLDCHDYGLYLDYKDIYWIHNWHQTTIRNWLNSYDTDSRGFQNQAFTSTELSAINAKIIPDSGYIAIGLRDLTGNDWTGARDKVTMLSGAELYGIANLGKNYELKTQATDYAFAKDVSGDAVTGYAKWWTKNGGYYDFCSRLAGYVDENGIRYNCNGDRNCTNQDRLGLPPNTNNIGVCPAIVLNLSETDLWCTQEEIDKGCTPDRGDLQYGRETGICGDHLTYVIEDGIITVSGTGVMYDYTEPNASPFTTRYKNMKKVVINDGVESIGSYAFYFDSLGLYHVDPEEVLIPASVKRIGKNAFKNFTPELPNLPEISDATPEAVTGQSVMVGDLDQDQLISLSDAKTVLSMALKITDTTKQAVLVGDADEDGVLTLNDANLILKAALKIISIHKVVILDPPTQSKPDSKEDVWKVDAPIGWEPYAESYVDPEFYIKHNDPYDDILNGSGYPPLQHKKK